MSLKNVKAFAGTLLLGATLFSCSQMSTGGESKANETAAATTEVEATTTVGKTYQQFSNLRTETMGNILGVAQEYYDKAMQNAPIGDEPPIPEDSRSGEELVVTKNFFTTESDELSFNDISNFFKQSSLGLSRSTDETEDDVEIIEVSMQNEIAEIIEAYNEKMKNIKPDVSAAATLDFVELSEDGEGVTIGGDQDIYPNSIYGALTIEMLNAVANGVNIDEAVKRFIYSNSKEL